MASQGEDRHERASVIRGHHVYKSIWTPMVGEELNIAAEDGNEHDRYAIMVTSCHAHHNDPAFLTNTAPSTPGI